MTTLQIDDSRLDVAVRAAKEAGSRAEEVKKTTPSERKHNDSLVTEADREAETIVRDILQKESPHPILGEEHGGDVTEEDTYWIIDPIDGTQNFAYEQPLYGCAIALVEEGEPEVGVWYMPELEHLFYGVSGKGAYRGDERLSVTDERDVERSYSIISGKGKEDIFPMVVSRADAAQQAGSAILSESWVASGWCDVGVFGALAPWDMAVGVILVREAGGVMKAVGTGDDDWNAISEGRVVFGNEPLVDSILNSLSEEEVTAVQNAEYDW